MCVCVCNRTSGGRGGGGVDLCIQVDGAHIIDQHSNLLAILVAKDALEKCRLACTQKTGQESHREDSIGMLFCHCLKSG